MKWLANVLVLCAAAAVALPAQTLATLYSFYDNFTEHANDPSGIVQGIDGNFYGATFNGGSNNGGAVFTITPAGTLTTLYSFCGSSGCLDGVGPNAGIVQAPDGDFYGTTCCYGPKGNYGTVFKITPGGELTTLHGFCSQSGCADGDNPAAGVIRAADGSFFGTTVAGGAHGLGTVFSITPAGDLKTIYSFCSKSGCADGQNPGTGLVQATNGEFYGTTGSGGASNAGTIFKITANGALTTLHSFCSISACTDGDTPAGPLIQAANGNLYGTTVYGGAHGLGTVYRITPGGTLATLYNFCSQGGTGLGGCTDGGEPSAGLIQATDGAFYGTAHGGGANGWGTVFKISRSGALTTLYNFCSQGGNLCTDGAYPSAVLLQATNGTFYGTTANGGANETCQNGCGTVFSLSVGLSPFVEPQTASGKVGDGVNILGTALTGATSVAFNGVAAAFEVMSSSEIVATVPAGATTGKIQVVAPSSTLSSNVPFRVQP